MKKQWESFKAKPGAKIIKAGIVANIVWGTIVEMARYFGLFA